MSGPVGPELPDELLDRMQYVADRPADLAVARIVGPWPILPEDAGAEALRAAHGEQWRRLAAATQLLSQMQDAEAAPGGERPPLASLIGDDPSVPGLGEVLRDFVNEGATLPEWAEPAKIERAERLFIEYGPLSCVLLFCASLPECYVIPDLAMVLNASGQLEKRTDYRIRMTAAMIFPVMMKGGMAANGAGIAQVLKVRLIHATIRHLILRGTPHHAVEQLGEERRGDANAGIVPAHDALAHSPAMFETMSAHGWKLGADGLPCNQEELAYTLLTFGYVFLRSLRRLGIGLAQDDEEAFLHCWNVAGHVLGIVTDLMPRTMDEAEALFDRMQARGRAEATASDPRPELGRALVATMERAIPFKLLKPFPGLMLRYLCGVQTARDLGVGGPVKRAGSLLFSAAMLLARGIDALGRVFDREFSISRFGTRIAGYRFVTRLLMDQSRPLVLPDHLLRRVDTMMDAWGEDPKAPGWVNRVEDRLTTAGSWRTATRPRPGNG